MVVRTSLNPQSDTENQVSLRSGGHGTTALMTGSPSLPGRRLLGRLHQPRGALGIAVPRGGNSGGQRCRKLAVFDGSAGATVGSGNCSCLRVELLVSGG